MDDLRPAGLGLHDPLEPDRVALGHVRALDDDAVGVLQVLLEGGGAASTERCPQTGDGGGVSYAGLVLDLDGTQGGIELLEEVVLLVVECGPAQMGEAERPFEGQLLLVVHLLPGGVPGGDDAVGDHVHRLVERELLPSGAVGPPILDLELPRGAVHQLLTGRALRAKTAAGDGAGRVTLDLGDLLAFDVHQLAATHGAVRADRPDDLVCGLGPRSERFGVSGLGSSAEAEVIVATQLAGHGPRGNQFSKAAHAVSPPRAPSYPAGDGP